MQWPAVVLFLVPGLLGTMQAYAEAPIGLGARLQRIETQTTASTPAEFSTSGHVTAVIFTSTQCPVSNAYNDRMKALYADYTPKGVQFVFLNANASESPADIDHHRAAQGFPFPVYRDAGNAFADKVGAQVTPHGFVFDTKGTLVYRGAIDNAKNPGNVTKQPLRDALDAALAGRPAPVAEVRAFGCSIERAR
jgi:thiol-disulfide isomerase/thioredoxin